jgi:hypothetical protein
MKSDRWQRIEELYHSAREQGESQRSAFLDEVCAADEALREEIESLLATRERSERSDGITSIGDSSEEDSRTAGSIPVGTAARRVSS